LGLQRSAVFVIPFSSSLPIVGLGVIRGPDVGLV